MDKKKRNLLITGTIFFVMFILIIIQFVFFTERTDTSGVAVITLKELPKNQPSSSTPMMIAFIPAISMLGILGCNYFKNK